MAKMKKVPMRMCLSCREMKPKRELIRIVMNKNGEISVDMTGKLAGRGAYICNSAECVAKLKKSAWYREEFRMQSGRGNL